MWWGRCINCITDMNIGFFEQLLENISDFKADTTLEDENRWRKLLESLSVLIGVSLGYISVTHLCQFEPYSLFSLLEIIDFLAENSLLARSKFPVRYVTSDNMKRDELLERVSHKPEKIHNVYSEDASTPICFHNSEPSNVNQKEENLKNGSENTVGKLNIDTPRLVYLRKRLKKCVSCIPFEENAMESDESCSNPLSQPDLLIIGRSDEKNSYCKSHNCGCKVY
ncbi:unnamed protein product [Heterobilharzia americana]|nr:unnamed protein product [Heterobilharzia americana]